MKTYFHFFFLCFSYAAIGQKHSVSMNYKPSLTYFGRQSQYFNNPYFVSRSGEATVNQALNILYKYMISSRIGLSAGLEYARQGQDVKMKIIDGIPGNDYAIYKTELNYVRIPLTVSCAIYKTKNSELNAYSGLSLGLVTKRKDNYQDIILEHILLPPADKRYKNKDWAMPIGIQYQKGFAKNKIIIFGLEYLVGLTNSFADNGISKFGVLSEFANSKQSRLSLNVGVGIKLGK